MAVASPARRIFLTGGTGYLGCRLIPLLVERGHSVRALTRKSSRHALPPCSDAVLANPLDSATFVDNVRGCDTLVQLVGVPRPAPWKGAHFRAIDRLSGLASIEAAVHTGVTHFIYVSVARPAPVMKDYIAVRAEIETALRASGLRATILRPWYILGPGHRWPAFLRPAYWLCERIPAARSSAARLGLVTLPQMLVTLVWSVEHPPESARVIEVPEIRTIGGAER